MTNTWTFRSDLSDKLGGSALDGYDVEATDGGIGKIDEHSSGAAAGYIVVDTGFWIFGKKRLIPAGVIRSVDTSQKKVYVDMTKDEIKAAPDFDEQARDGDDWYRRSTGDYYDPWAW